MMTAKEMLEKVQNLKEQVVFNGFYRTADVYAFFDENWIQILDILDDALYAYTNEVDNG